MSQSPSFSAPPPERRSPNPDSGPAAVEAGHLQMPDIGRPYRPGGRVTINSSPVVATTPLTLLERDGLRDLARLFRLASSLLDEAVATGRADFAIGAASKVANAGAIAAKVSALITSARSSSGESI